ncbi:MAG: helix-turn-helix domain-containing protein, partial [Pseudolabrys sp.]|nr:helix-turn-helix domain-containing protein [Pseudolabrys sp.]
MLRTQIAAAIGCARANALDEIMREVWTHYSAGQLSEEDAGALSALAQERRAAWRGSGQAALALVFPPPAARCPTPVRRRSYLKGQSEPRIWRPTTRKDVQAILKAAEIYNEAGLHEKGERSG